MTPAQKKKYLDWAEVIDAHRVVPKIIMGGYGYIVIDSWWWIKHLNDPTDSQQYVVNVIWIAAGGITKWYFETGRQWLGDKK